MEVFFFSHLAFVKHSSLSFFSKNKFSSHALNKRSIFSCRYLVFLVNFPAQKEGEGRDIFFFNFFCDRCETRDPGLCKRGGEKCFQILSSKNSYYPHNSMGFSDLCVCKTNALCVFVC